MRSFTVLALVLASSLGIARRARADEPPDRDSIEAHCTPAEQCPSGVICPRAVMHADVGAACRTDAAAKKLELRCSRRATHRDELFCPHGEKGSWSKGCAISSGDDRDGSVVALFAVLAALGTARRRSTPR